MISLGPVDTLVTTASAVVGQASDLFVTRSGLLLVTDRTNSVIHRIHPDSGYVGSIGREGEGPGEFRLIRGLAQTSDTIWVIDEGNRRIQGLHLDGTAVASRPYHRVPLNYPVTFATDELLLQPNLGYDTTLLSVHDRDGAIVSRMGTPNGLPVLPVSFSAIHEKAVEGELAPIFANMVSPAFEPRDSTIWVGQKATGWVHRYTLGGEAVDSVFLDEAEFSRVREEWVAANSESENALLLNLLHQARAVDGALWILLGSPEGGPPRIRIVTESGEKGARLEVPGAVRATLFAVDEERGRLYLSTPDDAQILAVEVPEEGLPGAGG